jgi:hypothetical protein
MFEDYIARLKRILAELEAGRETLRRKYPDGGFLTERDARAYLKILKRINTEIGRVQFDGLNEPHMDEEDREWLRENVNETIKGRDMIDAMERMLPRRKRGAQRQP